MRFNGATGIMPMPLLRPRTETSCLALTAAMLALHTYSAAAESALPCGGVVAAGSAHIGEPAGPSLTVTQTSPSAVINWQTFNVGAGNTVNFAQRPTDQLLNRVTGDSPSSIAGAINAGGSVYLINPNGITITPSGRVMAARGFVASTLGISDEDFMAGRRIFTGNGASAGVDNQGHIVVGRGGFTALFGGTVSNSGTINVPFGRVGLGSGERIALDLAGDGFLQVEVPTSASGKPLINVPGKISARGGRIELRAASVKEAIRDTVNVPGRLEARSVSGRNGAIVLEGGAGGRVAVAGRLDVSGKKVDGSIAISGHQVSIGGGANTRLEARSHDTKGGTISVTADGAVTVDTATLDASGGTGGGTILIGGGWQGGGSLVHAASTYVGENAVFLADATANGGGGQVVVWSDAVTVFHGMISARGAGDGAGGMAEVSSHGVLSFEGWADLTASSGVTGTLLLDPYNVTIQTAAGETNISCAAGVCTPTGDNSILSVATLTSALASSSVEVNTGSSGGQNGDITVADAISWSANTQLTLTAARGVVLNAGITNSGSSSGLVLTAGGSTGISGNGGLANSGTLTMNTAVDASSSYGGVVSGSGNVVYNGPGSLTLTGVNTYTGTTTINGGTLEIGGSGSLRSGNYTSSLSIVSGANFTYASSADQTFGDLAAGTGTINLNGTGIVTINGNQSFTGAINVGEYTYLTGGTGGAGSGLGRASSITVTNGGTIDLTSETNINAFIGWPAPATPVTINSGGKIIASGSTVMDLATLNLNGGELASTGEPGAQNGTYFLYGAINVTADSIISARGLVLGATGGVNFNVDSGATLSVTGTIVHPGNGTDTGAIKSGSGTMVLSGANTYTGTTTINGGTLTLSPSSSQTIGAINVGGGSSGATLVVNSGATVLNGNLTVAASATDTQSTAEISADLTAHRIFIGNANGAVGSVTQTAGTVTTTANSDPNFSVGAASGGTGTYNLSGGTLAIQTGTFNVGGYGSGTFNQTAGVVNSANWTIIGRRVGSVGVYNISGGQLNETGASVKIFVGEQGTGTLNVSGSGIVTPVGGLGISGGAGPQGVGTVNLNGGTIVTPLVGKNNGSSATFNFNGGLLQATADSATFMTGLTAVTVQDGGALISDDGHAITIGQALPGAGGLTKSGAGTLTLTGTNTYTGDTTVNAGTLKIGGAGSLGSGSYMANIAIASGAAFDYASSTGQTLSGEISGAGSLIKDTSSASTLILTGTNSYTGDTTVNAGTLKISGTGSLGSGSYMANIAVASGAAFDYASSAAQTLSGEISGAGSLIKETSSASALTLTGANTYTGTTTVSAGTLVIGNGGLTGSLDEASTITVAAGANINWLLASSLTLANAITGAGNVNVTLTGTGSNLTLANSQTVTGSGTITDVVAGNITINPSVTINGGGGVTLAAGGNFVNSSGASAVSSSGGRWLIYSSDPATDTFGTLDSSNTAVWNAAYATTPPASVTLTGNRYLFATQPTLTITTTDASKIYGTDVVADLAAHYAVSGYHAGVANAFLTDTASTAFSGAPAITSDGAEAYSSVSGSPYTIDAAQGSLISPSGYSFAYTNAGRLTVAAKPINYVVADRMSAYGSQAQTTVTFTGVLPGDEVRAIIAAHLNGMPVTLERTSAPGAYLVTVTGISGTEAGNYTLAPSGNTDGTLTIVSAANTAMPSGFAEEYSEVISGWCAPNALSGSGATPSLARCGRK